MIPGMTGEEAYALLYKKIQDIQISGGGVTDYRYLTGKPLINGVILDGSLTFEDLGIHELTESDVDKIIESLGGI